MWKGGGWATNVQGKFRPTPMGVTTIRLFLKHLLIKNTIKKLKIYNVKTIFRLAYCLK